MARARGDVCKMSRTPIRHRKLTHFTIGGIGPIDDIVIKTPKYASGATGYALLNPQRVGVLGEFMSKKAKIKTLEKMVRALRADVNKLKLEAAKHRTIKSRASGATPSTTTKVEKSTASPKEPISTVRISAQR